MKTEHQEPKISHPEQYDCFIDAIKLSLIMWRRNGTSDFKKIADKLNISERTARRRYHMPGTLTLQEFFAWCELYGKDPSEQLLLALTKAKKAQSGE